MAWFGGFLGGAAAILGLIYTVFFAPNVDINKSVSLQYIQIKGDDLLLFAKKEQGYMSHIEYPKLVQTKLVKKYKTEILKKNKDKGRKIFSVIILRIKNIGKGDFQNVRLETNEEALTTGLVPHGKAVAFMISIRKFALKVSKPIQERIVLRGLYIRIDDEVHRVSLPRLPNATEWQADNSYSGTFLGYPPRVDP